MRKIFLYKTQRVTNPINVFFNRHINKITTMNMEHYILNLISL